MDIAIHWGVLKNLRKKINPSIFIVISAIVLDVIVLTAFIWVKASADILIIIVSFTLMILIFVGEKWFLSRTNI